MLRQQECDIRSHQRQRDLDARIVRPAAKTQASPSDHDAVSDLADEDEDKSAGGLTKGEHAGADSGNGEAVKN